MMQNRQLGALGIYAICLTLGCTSASKDDAENTTEPSETSTDSSEETNVGPDPIPTPTNVGQPTATVPPAGTPKPGMGPDMPGTGVPSTTTAPTTLPTSTEEPNTDPTNTGVPSTSEPGTDTDVPMGEGGMGSDVDSDTDAPTSDASGTAEPSGPPVACESAEEETFSFFLISYDAIRRYSGSDQGFGGNLGGITGADGLCERAAVESSPCAANKTWRAFLSTTTEDAIDRIGTGPWRDRVGRLLANNTEELLNERPPNADPEIIDDFPNEYGIPNQFPNSDSEAVDNHETLTGTGLDGKLYTQEVDPDAGEDDGPGGGGGSTQCPGGWTPEKATCWDWTSSEPEGCPRVGHSWPSEFSGVSWISVWNESGCAPGVVLVQGPLADEPSVGSYGGYGGFYCFALTGE